MRKNDMRKIIVEAEISIDGAMGGENMDFWAQTAPFRSEDVTKYLNDLLFMPDALLLGRKTYEFFAQVWPTRQGNDAERINRMPKYVASRTLTEPLQWNATLLKGEAAEAIQRIKLDSGDDLVQYGVGELTHTMLKRGLVDELRILVYPFVFGAGPRIFEGMGVQPLKLLDSRTFRSGVVALHYQPQPSA